AMAAPAPPTMPVLALGPIQDVRRYAVSVSRAPPARAFRRPIAHRPGAVPAARPRHAAARLRRPPLPPLGARGAPALPRRAGAAVPRPPRTARRGDAAIRLAPRARRPR